MTWRDLRLRVRALLAPRRVERELDDELEFHLEMETRKNEAAGLSPDEARARARARFGSAAVAAEACRDARGTLLVETSLQDVAYAVRGFRRAPTVAITIVGTIALGLGLTAAVFTIFNALVFRVDAVRDPGSLFSVEKGSSGGRAPARFTLPEYEDLRRETDVFSGAFGRLSDITSRIDGRMMEGQIVTGNFFQVIGVGAALGRTLTQADDTPPGRPVIVLSHAGWSRLFAADPNVLGRTVPINGFRYEIVGVTPEGFRGLALLAPDYWAPFTLVGQFRPWLAGRENFVNIEVVGRLKPGLSRRTAQAGLAVWGSQRATTIRLQPGATAMPFSPAVLLGFSPLFIAFGLILLIGCANVANLLLARAVARQREIGIRLSLGASRRRVVRQLLTESLLLALVAAACAFVVSRLVLDRTTAAVMSTIPAELAELFTLTAPRADWRVAAFLVLAAILSTVTFGLVPALQATRFDLVRAVRGEVARNARPSRARNVLIAVQVTASALLLICAGVFLRGALRSAVADPGLRMADTITVDLVNEPLRRTMIEAVIADPSVTLVAATWPDAPPLGTTRAAFVGTSPVTYRFVSAEYFAVLGIDLVKGRPFTEAEATANAPLAIVSESTARQIWPNGDTIGQVLRLEPDSDSAARRENEPTLQSQALVVVGVARGVAGLRIGNPEAGVYVPAGPMRPKTSLIVRVQGDPEAARRSLLQRLTAIDPNMGNVMTMRTVGRLESYPLAVGFCLTIVLGGLALVLTLTGIFSVLSYLVEQRRQEIGVRIALGATTANVTRLVLSQSLRVVAVGLTAGGALAWSLATILMSTPVAERIGGLVDVLDPLPYIGSLLCIVMACALAAFVPALRAARIDPMATLREE